ncbi:Calcium-dependent protein kinase 8 (OsCDPK8) (OsCPK8) [Durusdinium trenchii]|uniref:Calcium-dependent protein kinase 8 (OsCDPK8) (OsCPK8) n=1 Tax=Durusdinium trenchii TaxID=1381693 RepID=A0ABP0SDF8_9DINO
MLNPATVRTVSRGREAFLVKVKPGPQGPDAYYTRVNGDEIEDCEDCADGDCGFSTVQREKWVHVGAGRGTYSKTNSMLYVGDNHGCYEKEQVIHRKWSWLSSGGLYAIFFCALAIILSGISLGLLINHYFLHAPARSPTSVLVKGGTLSPDAGHRPAVRPGHVPELGGAEKSTSRDGASELEDSEVGEDQREASRYPFDCRLERDGWDINWSKEKKEYCCSAVNFGCATEPFDCELQKDQFKTVWTPQKSAYCCDQHGFACDHAAQGCDRICHIFGQSASCQARAMHAFSKVGSCAQAHREVLDQCWVCDGCPAQGLNCADAKEKEEKEEKEKEEREKQKKEREKEQRDKDKMEKEEEERQKEEEEEEEEALRKGERDAWKLDRNKLPCHEPAKHGYMWRFDTKSSKHHWEQLPMEHGAHNTPAGRGFMWRKEGYNWMQVCIPFPSAEHLPNVPVGEGFMWHRRFDPQGQIWQQIPMTLHDAGKIGTVPKIPAGPGFWWKRVNGEWKQVPLPKDMRNRERPCNLRSGPGMRWVFRAAGGTAWQQLLIPGWKSHSVNPQPGVPPGEGFMWSFEPQDQGWTQICIPGWSEDEAQPPTLEAGTGFMWVHQGGSWHQLPVPRGLRRSCMEQPTESFAPAGQGFMWKCLRKDGLLAWHQVHRNTWHEDGPSKPPKDKPGTGLMWVYQDDYWQQQPIPGWISKQAPHLPAGPGLMWTRTTMNGVHVWRQDLIPDWEVDNRLHPPAEPAGEGMMWRYDEKNRKEWKQVRIGDWYSDSANHPPSEYAGNGLMWKFVSVDKNPGEWQQVDIPDWHVLDQFKLPNEAAGPGFMWKFDKDIGRWKQLPIPRWREAKSTQPPQLPAGEGYMWKYIKENAKDHWEQIQLPKSELLRQHPEPSEPAGKYFRWQYKTDGDRDHWEQVLLDNLKCTGILCNDLLLRMLDKDDALRPDATQCLEHPWFSGYSEIPPTLSVGVLQCVESYARMSELRKGIFLLLAHQYEVQKSALVELRALFTHFDVRNQGCLSTQDLKGVLVKSGMGGVAAERVCHALDRRRDGQITWTEFTAAAMWYVVCRNNKAIDAAFATFDSDQDGRVTAKDLQMVLADVRGQEAWRKQMPHMFEEMEKQEISSLRRTARDTVRGFVQLFKKEATKYANLDQFRQYLQQNMDFRAGDALYAVT